MIMTEIKDTLYFKKDEFEKVSENLYERYSYELIELKKYDNEPEITIRSSLLNEYELSKLWIHEKQYIADYIN